MLEALTLLFACQLAGEALVRLSGLAFPGPVLGMALMLGIVALAGRTGAALDGLADTILRNLSLLFVPAAVGVVQQLDLIASTGLADRSPSSSRRCSRFWSPSATFLAVARWTTRRAAECRRLLRDLGLSRGLAAPVADGDAGAYSIGERSRRAWAGTRSQIPWSSRRPCSSPCSSPPARPMPTSSRARSSSTSCSARRPWRSRSRSGTQPGDQVRRAPRADARSPLRGFGDGIGSAVASPGPSAPRARSWWSLAPKSTTSPIAMALASRSAAFPRSRRCSSCHRHHRRGRRHAADEPAAHHATSPRAASPPASPRTASARRAPSRSAGARRHLRRHRPRD
jgi:holin-like protein